MTFVEDLLCAGGASGPRRSSRHQDKLQTPHPGGVANTLAEWMETLRLVSWVELSEYPKIG